MYYKNILLAFLLFSSSLMTVGCNGHTAGRLGVDGDEQEKLGKVEKPTKSSMYLRGNPLERNPLYIATKWDKEDYEEVATAAAELARTQREEAQKCKEFVEAANEDAKNIAYQKIQAARQNRIKKAGRFKGLADRLEKEIDWKYLRDQFRNAPKEQAFKANYDNFSGYKSEIEMSFKKIGGGTKIGERKLLKQATLAFDKASEAVDKAKGAETIAKEKLSNARWMKNKHERKVNNATQELREKLVAKDEKAAQLQEALENAAAKLEDIAAILSAEDAEEKPVEKSPFDPPWEE